MEVFSPTPNLEIGDEDSYLLSMDKAHNVTIQKNWCRVSNCVTRFPKQFEACSNSFELSRCGPYLWVKGERPRLQFADLDLD